MLHNQQFYHSAAAHHAAYVRKDSKLAILIDTMSHNIGVQWSCFDYELVCSYIWGDDFGAPEMLLQFTGPHLKPKATELETLAQIPTFPQSQWACAYWLCEPIRLRA